MTAARGRKPFPAWGWWLAAAGAVLVAINTWGYLHSYRVPFYDYGVIQSMILNTAAGDPVPLRPADRAVSHLATHWTPVLFLAAWLNRLLPIADLYGWLMAAGWFAAAPALGALVWRLTGDARLAAVSGAALFLNALFRRTLFAGHFEHLAVVLQVGATLALVQRRRLVFALLWAALLGVREDLALYAIGFGLGLATLVEDRRARRDVLVAAAVAAGYFLLAWAVWMPAFPGPWGPGGQAALMQERWGRGGSLGTVIIHLLTHPWEPLRALAGIPVLVALAGFAFLPLRRPAFFVLASLPPLMALSLTHQADYRNFRYYNSGLFLGTLAVGSAFALATIARRQGGRRIALAISVTALVLGAVGWPHRNFYRDVAWFGIIPGGWPHAVSARERAVGDALRAYPWKGRSVVAGMYTFHHCPPSPRLWYLQAWREARADLIVLDRDLDGPVTALTMGLPGPAMVARAFEGGGYRRVEEPAPGLWLFERRP